MTKNVLFFGDSNTWGYIPGDGRRYPYEQRWTTVAAEALGADFRCIPDGLIGRTTVFEHPYKPSRNGRTGLLSSLLTHMPLDLLVIYLGANDLMYSTAEASARGLETLVDLAETIQERYEISSQVFPHGVRILLVAPCPLVYDAYVNFSDPKLSLRAESLRLPDLYRQVAERHGCAFLEAAAVAACSAVDGEHLPVEAHRALGLAIAEKIQGMFGA